MPRPSIAWFRACGQENQIFRIDHYLGKETVQNIMVLRFANTIFEPIWNRNYISSVQITAAETVGVEERAGYYESAGALRDMVQNHLTQMLAITAMEPPGASTLKRSASEKAKVLQAARLADENEPWNCCIRGQYGPGGSHESPLAGYRHEHGVDPNSTTETYVAMKLFIDNWRWQGVPFYVRTGKRLPKRLSEVVLTFREAPVHLFDAAGGGPTANQLILRIQPDEGAEFRFEVKSPGSGMRSRPVEMEFSYDESFGEPSDEGYVRLLADAMLSDPTLFTRSDEVEAAWRLYTPLLELIEDSPGSCRSIPTNPAPGALPPRMPCWRRTDCSGDAPDLIRPFTTCSSSHGLPCLLSSPCKPRWNWHRRKCPATWNSSGHPSSRAARVGANTFCLLIWQPAWAEQQLVRTGRGWAHHGTTNAP